ncbi:MAG TPA: DUF488 domain-containing protein [candidate division Zixibacteria bacterium]|nr:DUF488 domain-containing protein [candidate division Zixibacteria bacterium]MDD4917718.1 DUF488 domain-containing protein [candidate division Zixibacteria bacterium]MDM7973346.1 DUF488 domain-containing protein [candidate division Zixibacteria bacterium]HOD67628.1 DUF488 domain-containing protein [candidate division Zixibacteria bacterium]HOZ06943.1 DUF488 domain-containing protein [candidate division Zixibacteria bacterium]
MREIFTIGHSRLPFATFLGLLSPHGIAAIVDVRTRPYSRFAPQFNKSRLEAGLKAAGLDYLYFGDRLGGLPEDDRFYDDEGYVRYDRLAASPAFQAGIADLLEAAGRTRLVLMCAEEDPDRCHRRLLIAPELAARGVAVRHLRADGRAQADESGGAPLLLFPVSPAPVRRSPAPVRPRRV